MGKVFRWVENLLSGNHDKEEHQQKTDDQEAVDNDTESEDTTVDIQGRNEKLENDNSAMT